MRLLVFYSVTEIKETEWVRDLHKVTSLRNGKAGLKTQVFQTYWLSLL